jgi:hypothetical protein
MWKTFLNVAAFVGIASFGAGVFVLGFGFVPNVDLLSNPTQLIGVAMVVGGVVLTVAAGLAAKLTKPGRN